LETNAGILGIIIRTKPSAAPII